MKCHRDSSARHHLSPQQESGKEGAFKSLFRQTVVSKFVPCQSVSSESGTLQITLPSQVAIWGADYGIGPLFLCKLGLDYRSPNPATEFERAGHLRLPAEISLVVCPLVEQ